MNFFHHTIGRQVFVITPLFKLAALVSLSIKLSVKGKINILERNAKPSVWFCLAFISVSLYFTREGRAPTFLHQGDPSGTSLSAAAPEKQFEVQNLFPKSWSFLANDFLSLLFQTFGFLPLKRRTLGIYTRHLSFLSSLALFLNSNLVLTDTTGVVSCGRVLPPKCAIFFFVSFCLTAETILSDY